MGNLGNRNALPVDLWISSTSVPLTPSVSFLHWDRAELFAKRSVKKKNKSQSSARRAALPLAFGRCPRCQTQTRSCPWRRCYSLLPIRRPASCRCDNRGNPTTAADANRREGENKNKYLSPCSPAQASHSPEPRRRTGLRSAQPSDANTCRVSHSRKQRRWIVPTQHLPRIAPSWAPTPPCVGVHSWNGEATRFVRGLVRIRGHRAPPASRCSGVVEAC